MPMRPWTRYARSSSQRYMMSASLQSSRWERRFDFKPTGRATLLKSQSNIRVLYEEARNTDIEVYSKRIPGYARSRGVFGAAGRGHSGFCSVSSSRTVAGISLIGGKADIKGGEHFKRPSRPRDPGRHWSIFHPQTRSFELAVGVIQPTASDLVQTHSADRHFLTKTLQHVVKSQGTILTAHDLHEFKFFHLHGIEKSDRMVRIAMTDMMLNDDDGHTNIRNEDALLSFENCRTSSLFVRTAFKTRPC